MTPLETHIFIEFFFNGDGGTLLNEHRYDRKLLLEKYGVFDGCVDIVDSIFDYLADKRIYSFQRTFTIPVRHKYFKDIRILFDKNTSTAKYLPDESAITDGVFDVCTILMPLHATKDSVQSLLYHELTHAYEDLNRRKRGVSLGIYADKIGYHKNPMTVPPEDSTEAAVSYLLYLLSSFERNAYIAQVRAEFERRKKDEERNGNPRVMEFETIDDVMRFIHRMDIYSSYRTILAYAKRLTKVRDRESQEKILNYVNSHSNHAFKDYKAFVRWVGKKAYVCEDKLERMMPKIAAEYLHVEPIRKGGLYSEGFLKKVFGDLRDEINN